MILYETNGQWNDTGSIGASGIYILKCRIDIDRRASRASRMSEAFARSGFKGARKDAPYGSENPVVHQFGKFPAIA